jgi:hypothetical protein
MVIFFQGILVFASVMATLGLQIILESMRSLASDVSLSCPHLTSFALVALWIRCLKKQQAVPTKCISVSF